MSTKGSTDHDLAEVLSYLVKNTAIPTLSKQEMADVRKLHRAAYSIVLWSHYFRLPENGQIFLNECASDAIQILPNTLLGFQKGAMLLTRGIIENSLRHIYFADHSVEYRKMNLSPMWFVTPEQLFEYAKEHPELAQAEKKFDALGRMRVLYRELSAGVHGAKVVDLGLKKALRDVRFRADELGKMTRLLSRAAESVNFVLFVFNKARISKLPPASRRLLLLTMTKAGRRVCTGLS